MPFALNVGCRIDIVTNMRTHSQIERRSLALAREIVALIDADPAHKGLLKARGICARWYRENPAPAIKEWLQLLEGDWRTIRGVLLDESENGARLRQSNPFCGILSSQARWAIYRRSSHEPKAA
jgi:hypothetical protein